MRLPPNSVGKDRIFSAINHSFVWTDLATTISHERMSSLDETYIEYSLALLMTWLDSGGQRSRSQHAVNLVKESTTTLGHRSPFSGLSPFLYLILVPVPVNGNDTVM